MKSNELRIGNKVQVSIFENVKDFKENVKDTDIKQEWFIGSIESIEPFNPDYTYHIDLETKDKYANNVDEWERVEPIPLTEKWLKKSGFQKNKEGDVYWFERDLGAINLISTELTNDKNSLYLFDYEADKVRVYFVHQLQNLYFSLMGVELVFSEA